MSSIPANIKKYYVLRFLDGLIFTYVIQVIFLVGRGITAPQLALFASLSIIFSTVFEIPTGFVADRFGRKISVALGYTFDALALILLIFVDDFNILIAVAFLNGLRTSLISGALESLTYEHISDPNDKESFLKVMTNGSKIAISVGVFATFVSPILYFHNHELPFILSAVVSVAMAAFVLTFHEATSGHEVSRNVQIFDGIKNVFKSRPILFIVLIDLFLLIFVHIYYRVAFFPKVTALGLDVRYLGVVDVITLGITSLFLHFLPRLQIKNEKATLAIYTLIAAILFVIFVFSGTLGAVLVFGVLFDPTWNLRKHIIPIITNKYFESKNRALNISSMSFLSNLGAALMVPGAVFLFTKSYFYSLIPLAIIIALLIFYPKSSLIKNKLGA